MVLPRQPSIGADDLEPFHRILQAEQPQRFSSLAHREGRHGLGSYPSRGGLVHTGGRHSSHRVRVDRQGSRPVARSPDRTPGEHPNEDDDLDEKLQPLKGASPTPGEGIPRRHHRSDRAPIRGQFRAVGDEPVAGYGWAKPLQLLSAPGAASSELADELEGYDANKGTWRFPSRPASAAPAAPCLIEVELPHLRASARATARIALNTSATQPHDQEGQPATDRRRPDPGMGGSDQPVRRCTPGRLVLGWPARKPSAPPPSPQDR
jgi:hypothetical protein